MLADRFWNRTDDAIDGFKDLLDLGVSAEFLLGEHKLVSDHHFEHAAARRDDCHVFDVVFELPEDCFSHAHGTVGIASRSAVLN